MIKKIFILFLLVSLFGSTSGQGVADALRYSQMTYTGTARFNAMGGSFGALGGELSSLLINPAGIGVYRNSEFSISSALLTSNLSSNFLNNEIVDNSVNFNIPNIGFVSNYKGDSKGWKNYSFAIGHNRVNNFRGDYLFRGTNRNSSSFVDPYVLDLNEFNPSTEDLLSYTAFPFGPAQAFTTFAIDTFRNAQGELYYDRWLLGEESIEQNQEVETSGRQSETYVSFGGNYQDRLYLGANIGIQSIRYEQEIVRTERYNYATPPPPGVVDITDYFERTQLLTRGTGFNVKLGFIYRFKNNFRIGGAFHSPTYFGLNEEYVFDARSSFSNGDSFEAGTVESNYDFQLRTPMRLNASVAYVYNRIALFNFDYEYVDYTRASFDDSPNDPFDFSPTNTQIKDILTAAHNFRFGAEIRFDPFVARAGFRYETSPFSEEISTSFDESNRIYSLGGGFRVQNFNIDLAYQYNEFDFIDTFYETSPNQASVNAQQHLITATIGWRW